MYDIDTKNVKKGKNIWYIFLAVGILFFIIITFACMLIIKRNNSLDSSVMSTRVIVNSGVNDEGILMYSPVYYYEVDGIEYVCSTTASSSENPGTENKKVYYDSNNPSVCESDFSKSIDFVFFVVLIVPIVFIILGIFNIKKINKRVKAIDELNQKGKLVKSLPYRLEKTGTVVNGVPIRRPVIDYMLPSGSVITLYGDPRNDKKMADTDGLVDLLIDESNPSNYYIDFEINRLTGNLPEDYSNQPTQVNSADQYSQYQPSNYSNSIPVQNQQMNMNNQYGQVNSTFQNQPMNQTNQYDSSQQ